MAPVIMTVCRNVHANTPYCIWNSIMDKIFKLKTKVRGQCILVLCTLISQENGHKSWGGNVPKIARLPPKKG